MKSAQYKYLQRQEMEEYLQYRCNLRYWILRKNKLESEKKEIREQGGIPPVTSKENIPPPVNPITGETEVTTVTEPKRKTTERDTQPPEIGIRNDQDQETQQEGRPGTSEEMGEVAVLMEKTNPQPSRKDTRESNPISSLEMWEWICDSGATSHMVRSDAALQDPVLVKVNLSLGSGKIMEAVKRGNMKAWIPEPSGKLSWIMLYDVLVVPGLTSNLISLTRLLRKGLKLGNDGKEIYVRHKNYELRFGSKSRQDQEN